MKKSVLFVVDALTMGGVTRVLANLLDRFDYEKYDVDLLVLHYHADMDVQIHPKVKLLKGDATYKYVDQSLGQILAQKDFGALFGKLKLVFFLKTGWIKRVIRKSRKKILKKAYDTEVSFNDGFTQIFVSLGDTPRKIGWAHEDVSIHNSSQRYGKLMQRSLERLDMLVCVSQGILEAYKSVFGLKRLCVIHNILDADAILEKAKCTYESPYSSDFVNLVSVGRLCEQKSYTRFINVHKRLVEQNYKVRSYIIGDGLEKQALENQIQALDIADSFTLIGRKDNPFPYVKDADIFVLSSIYEGLPTVLYEALILGIPCVSTRVAGAEEILQDRYGLVTNNDEDSLYKGLKQLLDNGAGKEYKDNLKNYRFGYAQTIAKVESIL